MRSDLCELVFAELKPPEQLENMSVVVDTLRVNGNSCGKSYGNNVPGAGSVYNSFKLFARFFCDVSHFGTGFSKKYLPPKIAIMSIRIEHADGRDYEIANMEKKRTTLTDAVYGARKTLLELSDAFDI